MTEGAAAAAAAAEQTYQAIKASGVLVRVEPEEFRKLLARQEEPLVVCAVGGFLSTNYQYLFGHNGLVFYTKSAEQLALPAGTSTVVARSIWIPG